MANTTINLSLPVELKLKAQQQAQARLFTSTSDYLQHLIRADSDKADSKKKIEAFLQKGLDSGVPEELSLDSLNKFMTKIIET